MVVVQLGPSPLQESPPPFSERGSVAAHMPRISAQWLQWSVSAKICSQYFETGWCFLWPWSCQLGSFSYPWHFCSLSCGLALFSRCTALPELRKFFFGCPLRKQHVSEEEPAHWLALCSHSLLAQSPALLCPPLASSWLCQICPCSICSRSFLASCLSAPLAFPVSPCSLQTHWPGAYWALFVCPAACPLRFIERSEIAAP